jgi:hypothetical protein
MSPYLVGAYAVFWAFTFALVLSIWGRQRRVAQEIAMLKVRLEEDRGGKRAQHQE